jgi:hypothetical protein
MLSVAVITASNPIPLGGNDYSLPSSENESNAHHNSYAGGVDQLRRDASIGQSANGYLSLSAHYMPNRPSAHDGQ